MPTEAEGNFDILLFTSSRAIARTGINLRLSAKYTDIILLCAISNYFLPAASREYFLF